MELENEAKLDILSKLINMQLEHVAGSVLANLCEIDLANAVVANPEWSAVADDSARTRGN